MSSVVWGYTDDGTDRTSWVGAITSGLGTALEYSDTEDRGQWSHTDDNDPVCSCVLLSGLGKLSHNSTITYNM